MGIFPLQRRWCSICGGDYGAGSAGRLPGAASASRLPGARLLQPPEVSERIVDRLLLHPPEASAASSAYSSPSPSLPGPSASGSGFRESKVAALIWKELSVFVRDGRRSGRVVRGSSGYALPGTLTVIMGPGRSGKSTLHGAIAAEAAEEAGGSHGVVPAQAAEYGTANQFSSSSSSSSSDQELMKALEPFIRSAFMNLQVTNHWNSEYSVLLNGFLYGVYCKIITLNMQKVEALEVELRRVGEENRRLSDMLRALVAKYSDLQGKVSGMMAAAKNHHQSSTTSEGGSAASATRKRTRSDSLDTASRNPSPPLAAAGSSGRFAFSVTVGPEQGECKASRVSKLYVHADPSVGGRGGRQEAAGDTSRATRRRRPSAMDEPPVEVVAAEEQKLQVGGGAARLRAGGAGGTWSCAGTGQISQVRPSIGRFSFSKVKTHI